MAPLEDGPGGPFEDAIEEFVVLSILFTCSSCGRTDLPEAGEWDPPICQECDAAINFDAELAAAEADELDEEW